MKCEVCKNETANSISQIGGWYSNEWKIVGDCVAETTECYFIPIDRLGEFDWIDHLTQKTWFDIVPFSKALLRLSAGANQWR